VVVASTIVPVNLLGPTPSAIKAKSPKDELEFVRSHAAPDPQNTDTSSQIVKSDTN